MSASRVCSTVNIGLNLTASSHHAPIDVAVSASANFLQPTAALFVVMNGDSGGGGGSGRVVDEFYPDSPTSSATFGGEERDPSLSPSPLFSSSSDSGAGASGSTSSSPVPSTGSSGGGGGGEGGGGNGKRVTGDSVEQVLASLLNDEDQRWISLFDNLLRTYPRRRNNRSCSCERESHHHGDHDDDGSRCDDEPDRGLSLMKTPAARRSGSAPPVRRAIFNPPNKPPAVAASGQAGAVDEESFIKQFEDVPKTQIFSLRDLDEQAQKLKDILSDTNTDWEKRIEALKKVRALILAGAANYDELYIHLRLLEQPFQLSARDLRSQVVREACVTIAYLSQQLGHKVDHFSEALLPSLINLIPNSAKVMATAGIVAVRFVIQYTHASRLIPIITTNMTSKSKEIRRACCEFLDQLLHTWPTHPLERHIAILQEAIKKCISDADPEARASSRKAFWGFHDHFKEQGDSLLLSLDTNKQRMLQGEVSMSSSSSNNSLQNSAGRGTRSRASSAAGSTENLSRLNSYGIRRSGIPVLGGGRGDGPMDGMYMSNGSHHLPSPMRSNSAIDMNAVQRARARQLYAHAGRMKVGSYASLPRPPRKIKEPVANSLMTSPERVARTPTRVGVSQSQPSSRSGSPSSRLSYATYNMHTAADAAAKSRRKSGSTVSSTGASRETSPNRGHYGGHERRPSGTPKRVVRPHGPVTDRSYGTATTSIGATPQYGESPQVMAQRILLQSQEAEAAMADALRVSSRRKYDLGNESDGDSETSSICSERSYGSLGRGVNDVAEVIHNLSSQHWSDRKEGLLGLTCLLQQNRLLTQTELKKVTDMFTKMFMDPHTKVFTIFLDTLNELVVSHKADLHDWLYLLVTRLLNKQGTDLLGSVLAKIQKSLEVVRKSFPFDEQFHILIRFLTDQTQTPNVKVKTAILNYMHILSQYLDGSDLRSSPDTAAAFTKIATWTSDPKSAELRKAAQSVLFAYFGLNTPEFTKILNFLPRSLQESTSKLFQNMIRSPQSPMTPRQQLPNTVSRQRQVRLSTPDLDDTENMNPEDIYVSLRETSAEIQNYSFDGLDRGFTKDRRELDRDTTSQDSGISQMSMVDGRMDVLEEKYESSPEDNSPVRRLDFNASLYQEQAPPVNGFGLHYINESVLAEELAGLSLNNIEDILAIISDVNKRIEERISSMTRLAALAKTSSEDIWDVHFRLTLRTLLDTLEDADSCIRTKSLLVLCEVLHYQSSRFEGFTDLTILKVLSAQKDPDKEVVRAVELCAATLATVLSTEISIRVINPIIVTGDFPTNLAAIKMLSKVVEKQPQQDILLALPQIMPGLLKAYNSPESSVRKAAVFCIVALHASIGETGLRPFLSELNGSKMKLLNVYIKRSQIQAANNSQASSSPGSPKTMPLPPKPQ